MLDLFRFVMIRPPEKSDRSNAITIQATGDLGKQLREAAASGGATAFQDLRKIAAHFIRNGQLAKSVNNPLDHQFSTFYKDLLDMSGHENLALLVQLVQRVFNISPTELISDSNFIMEKGNLENAIIIIKISPSNIAFSLAEKILHNIHLISLIERIASNDSSLNDNNSIQLSLSSNIVLPSDLFPLSPPIKNSDEPFDDKNDPLPSSSITIENREGKKLSENIQTLKDTFNTLRTLHPNEYAVYTINIKEESRIKSDETINHPHPPTLKQETVDAFPQNVKSVLSDMNLDLTKLSVEVATKKISDRLKQLYLLSFKRNLITSDSKDSKNVISRIGNSFFPLSDIPDMGKDGTKPQPWQTAQLPSLKNRIRPIGVADLLVVKHTIKRYEPGELSNIENILKGEFSKHMVRREDTIEESTTTETQTTKEEERDLQTTERFDLKNETQNTVNERGNLSSGLSNSTSYGPVLEFRNDNNTPVTGSQQLSQMQASSFSKDITTHAASKVSETVKKQVLLRTVHKFEDKNIHGFDNTKQNAKNVTGIYQWINKTYEAQVFSYGKRLMYDIIVPEPAAFLMYALATTIPEGQGLVKPDELNPEEIDQTNYLIYAEKYEAGNSIEAPPDLKIVTKTYDCSNNFGNTISKIDDLPIPKGYYASQFYNGTVAFDYAPGPHPFVVKIGSTIVMESDDLPRGTNVHVNIGLNNEEDSTGVIINAQNVLKLLLTIQIRCWPTGASNFNWLLQTRAAIQQAYLRKLSEYERRLASLQAILRSNIASRSPNQNLIAIKTELKKACISLFTYQQYETFNAIKYSSEGYPEIDFDRDPEAQGSYIRFFERALEWEQMTYLFYPYFWSRKENWTKRALMSDPDPIFQEFLMAGAARVVVPVRPGYELALTSFMDTGDYWWIGGSVPSVVSDPSADLIEEIKGIEGVPLDEVPYGDPWEVKLTTTLVQVREDSKLPSWKEDPPKSGNWVPEQ